LATGAKVSQIQYGIYIPYNQLKEYLTMMIQNKLIIYVKEEKIFKIIEYGMYTLKLYDKMDKIISLQPTKQSLNRQLYS
jgi:predicted transcriptional regulator